MTDREPHRRVRKRERVPSDKRAHPQVTVERDERRAQRWLGGRQRDRAADPVINLAGAERVVGGAVESH